MPIDMTVTAAAIRASGWPLWSAETAPRPRLDRADTVELLAPTSLQPVERVGLGGDSVDRETEQDHRLVHGVAEHTGNDQDGVAVDVEAGLDEQVEPSAIAAAAAAQTSIPRPVRAQVAEVAWGPVDVHGARVATRVLARRGRASTSTRTSEQRDQPHPGGDEEHEVASARPSRYRLRRDRKQRVTMAASRAMVSTDVTG